METRLSLCKRVLIEKEPFGVTPRSDFWASGNWPAYWIDVDTDESQKASTTAFRLGFFLPEGKTIRVHVSADERYHLWLNGQRVGRGPERSDLSHWAYESYDLELPSGKHTLVAHTWWLGPGGRPVAQMSYRPAFLLAAEGLPGEILNTGVAHWEAKRLAGWKWTGFEMCWGTGLRCEQTGEAFSWGFEHGQGNGWELAKNIAVVGSGKTSFSGWRPWRLAPASLPPMVENLITDIGVARHIEKIEDCNTRKLAIDKGRHLDDECSDWKAFLSGQSDLKIPPETGRRVIIDLGVYRTAYIELETSGGKGARIHLQWAEGLFCEPDGKGGKGNRNEIDGKYFYGVGNSFRPDGGNRRHFETIWWEAGLYLEAVITTGAEPLTIHFCRLRETHYPQEISGDFSADDDRLEKVSGPALRTLLACSHETYMDCPYYEQLMYVGDTRLEALVTYALSRDERLPKRAIELFRASILTSGLTQSRYPCDQTQIIPPFSLWWVVMVHDFHYWKNDPVFVAAQMPGVRRVIDAYLSCMGQNFRVINPFGWNFMDWVPGWKVGESPDGQHGQTTALTSWLFIWVLSMAAELEDDAREPEMASRLRRICEHAARTADDLFWNEKRGLYADDLDHHSFSEHTQCLAFLSGSVPSPKKERLSAGLIEDPHLHRTTIYFRHYLFEVLGRLGRTDKIIEGLGLWFELDKLGCTTTLEAPEPSRSDCHAWASHPLFHYGATILGIRPAQKGFASVRMTPQLGPLPWAKGSVAHPKGLIRVDLKRVQERLTGHVELPPGVFGTFVSQGKETQLAPGLQEIV